MADKHDDHKVPLWGMFLALLVLTVAEVGLYETWSAVPALKEAIPKYALVLTILIFTLPKAMIVLVWFMHLKFEKLFVVILALCPFVFAAIAVLPTLTDVIAVKDRSMGRDIIKQEIEAQRALHDQDDEHGDDKPDPDPGSGDGATPDDTPADDDGAQTSLPTAPWLTVTRPA